MATSGIEQFTRFLNATSIGKKLFLLFVLLISAVGFGSLIFWNSKPDYYVLFSSLSQEDAGEIANKLKEKKIPFQSSYNGTALLVPKDLVYETRLAIVAEGLPKGGGVGFEVFDRTNLSTTDFVQKLNYQRALQGELSRTIKQIKEVDQARVHIVTPKESLFVEEQKKPTASVFLKTRSGMALGASQVEGIVHLVASAVEGLEPGNITVVDPSGKILSKRSDATLIGQLTTTQLEYQRNIEEGLKKKVQGMLEEVLGFNKVIARVSTDLDFQQIESTEERYDPSTVLRSEQKNVERVTAATGLPGGGETRSEPSPDAKASKPKPSGMPEPQAKVQAGVSPSANTPSSERQHEIRNYEISRFNKRVKDSVGKVKKISTAVIVDGTYKEESDDKGKRTKQYVSRSPEEMKSFESIVKKAIGYDSERGDQVEVINMPFYWPTIEEDTKPIKGSPWQEYLLMYYRPVVSLILAFLFILFVVRPLMKKKTFSPEREVPLLPSGSPAMIPAQMPQVARASVPLALRDEAVKLIQEDPSKTVGIVKSWLHEKE